MPVRVLAISILVYGALNAILYSSLLPLWEGFDELFHYGYVQTLATGRSLSVFGQGRLSEEIWASVKLAPASHVVKQNIPSVMLYSEYFRLDRAERRALRDRLESLDPELRNKDLTGPLNYEVHQTPLPYIVLAALDHFWARGASVQPRMAPSTGLWNRGLPVAMVRDIETG